MKVLVISGGSARGNTSVQCQSFVSSLPEGWETEVIRIGDRDIRHCDGCDSCVNGVCKHDDHMGKVLDSFDSADAVVFATPIRFNGPSSSIKTVLDRFQLVWRSPERISHRRRFMTFMASSGSDNPDPRPCTTIFRSFCLSFGGEWVEPHLFAGTDRSTDGLSEAAASFALQFSSEIAKRTDS